MNASGKARFSGTLTVILMAPILAMSGCESSSKQAAEREQEASALVQEFAGQLKPRLQQAMTEGGPVHAVQVCAQEAPRIAASISEQSGWHMRRVSSRNRNPGAVPDRWEQSVIERFEKNLADGADPAALTFGEMTREGYRFAKAQVAEPMCLVCHGQTIAPDVEKALADLYPEDLARGYQAGDIRGIFSVSLPNP